MIRDYCYVKDIARASIIATGSNKVGIFNIGTGKGTHTLDLYTETIKALRSKGKIIPSQYDEPKRDAARLGDIKVSTLNPGKAKRELSWVRFSEGPSRNRRLVWWSLPFSLVRLANGNL
jgi:UDP-glucose 4-epimerase